STRVANFSGIRNELMASKGIRTCNALHLPTSDEHRRSGRRDRTLLEAVGTTENMKGERCSTRCQSAFRHRTFSPAIRNISTARACWQTRTRQIFSTFGTRDLDKSRPDMNCGTHVIAVGTGKYAG